MEEDLMMGDPMAPMDLNAAPQQQLVQDPTMLPPMDMGVNTPPMDMGMGIQPMPMNTGIGMPQPIAVGSNGFPIYDRFATQPGQEMLSGQSQELSELAKISLVGAPEDNGRSPISNNLLDYFEYVKNNPNDSLDRINADVYKAVHTNGMQLFMPTRQQVIDGYTKVYEEQGQKMTEQDKQALGSFWDEVNRNYQRYANYEFSTNRGSDPVIPNSLYNRANGLNSSEAFDNTGKKLREQGLNFRALGRDTDNLNSNQAAQSGLGKRDTDSGLYAKSKMDEQVAADNFRKDKKVGILDPKTNELLLDENGNVVYKDYDESFLDSYTNFFTPRTYRRDPNTGKLVLIPLDNDTLDKQGIDLRKVNNLQSSWSQPEFETNLWNVPSGAGGIAMGILGDVLKTTAMGIDVVTGAAFDNKDTTHANSFSRALYGASTAVASNPNLDQRGAAFDSLPAFALSVGSVVQSFLPIVATSGIAGAGLKAGLSGAMGEGVAAQIAGRVGSHLGLGYGAAVAGESGYKEGIESGLMTEREATAFAVLNASAVYMSSKILQGKWLDGIAKGMSKEQQNNVFAKVQKEIIDTMKKRGTQFGQQSTKGANESMKNFPMKEATQKYVQAFSKVKDDLVDFWNKRDDNWMLQTVLNEEGLEETVEELINYSGKAMFREGLLDNSLYKNTREILGTDLDGFLADNKRDQKLVQELKDGKNSFSEKKWSQIFEDAFQTFAVSQIGGGLTAGVPNYLNRAKEVKDQQTKNAIARAVIDGVSLSEFTSMGNELKTSGKLGNSRIDILTGEPTDDFNKTEAGMVYQTSVDMFKKYQQLALQSGLKKHFNAIQNNEAAKDHVEKLMAEWGNRDSINYDTLQSTIKLQEAKEEINSLLKDDVGGKLGITSALSSLGVQNSAIQRAEEIIKKSIAPAPSIHPNPVDPHAPYRQELLDRNNVRDTATDIALASKYGEVFDAQRTIQFINDELSRITPNSDSNIQKRVYLENELEKRKAYLESNSATVTEINNLSREAITEDMDEDTVANIKLAKLINAINRRTDGQIAVNQISDGTAFKNSIEEAFINTEIKRIETEALAQRNTSSNLVKSKNLIDRVNHLKNKFYMNPEAHPDEYVSILEPKVYERISEKNPTELEKEYGRRIDLNKFKSDLFKQKQLYYENKLKRDDEADKQQTNFANMSYDINAIGNLSDFDSFINTTIPEWEKNKKEYPDANKHDLVNILGNIEKNLGLINTPELTLPDQATHDDLYDSLLFEIPKSTLEHAYTRSLDSTLSSAEEKYTKELSSLIDSATNNYIAKGETDKAAIDEYLGNTAVLNKLINIPDSFNINKPNGDIIKPLNSIADRDIIEESKKGNYKPLRDYISTTYDEYKDIMDKKAIGDPSYVQDSELDTRYRKLADELHGLAGTVMHLQVPTTANFLSKYYSLGHKIEDIKLFEKYTNPSNKNNRDVVSDKLRSLSKDIVDNDFDRLVDIMTGDSDPENGISSRIQKIDDEVHKKQVDDGTGGTREETDEEYNQRIGKVVSGQLTQDVEQLRREVEDQQFMTNFYGAVGNKLKKALDNYTIKSDNSSELWNIDDNVLNDAKLINENNLQVLEDIQNIIETIKIDKYSRDDSTIGNIIVNKADDLLSIINELNVINPGKYKTLGLENIQSAYSKVIDKDTLSQFIKDYQDIEDKVREQFTDSSKLGYTGNSGSSTAIGLEKDVSDYLEQLLDMNTFNEPDVVHKRNALISMLGVDNNTFFKKYNEYLEGNGQNYIDASKEVKNIASLEQMEVLKELVSTDLMMNSEIVKMQSNASMNNIIDNNHTIFINAPAASGKTTYLVKDYLSMMGIITKAKGEKLNIAITAPNETQVDNLHKQLNNSIGIQLDAANVIKAKDNLEHIIDLQTKLMKNDSSLEKLDYLVIDEATLIPSEDINGVTLALYNYNKNNSKNLKLVLVGDPYQLASQRDMSGGIEPAKGSIFGIGKAASFPTGEDIPFFHRVTVPKQTYRYSYAALSNIQEELESLIDEYDKGNGFKSSIGRLIYKPIHELPSITSYLEYVEKANGRYEGARISNASTLFTSLENHAKIINSSAESKKPDLVLLYDDITKDKLPDINGVRKIHVNEAQGLEFDNVYAYLGDESAKHSIGYQYRKERVASSRAKGFYHQALYSTSSIPSVGDKRKSIMKYHVPTNDEVVNRNTFKKQLLDKFNGNAIFAGKVVPTTTPPSPSPSPTGTPPSVTNPVFDFSSTGTPYMVGTRHTIQFDADNGKKVGLIAEMLNYDPTIHPPITNIDDVFKYSPIIYSTTSQSEAVTRTEFDTMLANGDFDGVLTIIRDEDNAYVLSTFPAPNGKTYTSINTYKRICVAVP